MDGRPATFAAKLVMLHSKPLWDTLKMATYRPRNTASLNTASALISTSHFRSASNLAVSYWEMTSVHLHSSVDLRDIWNAPPMSTVVCEIYLTRTTHAKGCTMTGSISAQQYMAPSEMLSEKTSFGAEETIYTVWRGFKVEKMTSKSRDTRCVSITCQLIRLLRTARTIISFSEGLPCPEQ